jgi:hypothetical protein
LESKIRYLVDRYAQSLTKYDSKVLFESLTKTKGSIKAASEETEITRKTVYDWQTSSNEMKSLTKRKILDASFENDYFGTMEMLIRKITNDKNEILERYIHDTLNRLLAVGDQQEFEKQINKFERYLKDNSGSIFDIPTIRLSKIIELVNKKANSLGAKGIAPSVDLIKPQALSEKFIQFIELTEMPTPTEEFALKLGLPDELIARALKAENYTGPPTGQKHKEFEWLMTKTRQGITGLAGMGIETEQEDLDLETPKPFKPYAGSRSI